MCEGPYFILMQPVKQRYRLVITTKATHKKAKQKPFRSDLVSFHFSLFWQPPESDRIKNTLNAENSLVTKAAGHPHPLISHIIPGVSLSSPAPTGSFKSTAGATGERLKSDPDVTVELMLCSQANARDRIYTLEIVWSRQRGTPTGLVQFSSNQELNLLLTRKFLEP